MGKFKVGDKVKCVDNSDFPRRLSFGKVYDVVELSESMQYVRILDDTGEKSGYNVSRFELVKEPAPKFRVGMRVWGLHCGWTVIIDIKSSNDLYPIKTGEGGPFTTDGKRFDNDKYPSLFLDEIKPEDWPNPPAPKPKASELKVGEHIECTTNFSNGHYLRREVVFVAGEQVWVQDIYNSNTALKVIDWRLPSPE